MFVRESHWLRSCQSKIRYIENVFEFQDHTWKYMKYDSDVKVHIVVIWRNKLWNAWQVLLYLNWNQWKCSNMSQSVVIRLEMSKWWNLFYALFCGIFTVDPNFLFHFQKLNMYHLFPGQASFSTNTVRLLRISTFIPQLSTKTLRAEYFVFS